MKRPQCALLAEACRLLGAVLALTSQGGATSEAKRMVYFNHGDPKKSLKDRVGLDCYR